MSSFSRGGALRWTRQIGRVLVERGQGSEVLDRVSSCYTSFESLSRLWNRLRWSDLDIVVIYHGWNDMAYSLNIEDMPTLRCDEITGESEPSRRASLQFRCGA